MAAGAGTAAAGAGGLVIEYVGEQGGQRAGVGMAVDVVRVGEGGPDPLDQRAHGRGSLGEQARVRAGSGGPCCPRGVAAVDISHRRGAFAG